MNYIQKNTSAFRKACIALFAGGFTTFAVMYCTQPLMPEFSRDFNISPTAASLSISFTTTALAISMLFVGSMSEVKGRKKVMVFSLISASILAVLTAFVTNFNMLLTLRVFQGIVLAGLPAVAMAYLGEEIEPTSLGMAMGLYISGNSIGGMGGRIIIGTLTGFFNWRIALGTIGILSFLASLLFLVILPKSKNFHPRPFDVKKLIQSMVSHLKDPTLLYLYGVAFLIMGSFVTMFDYISYQLLAPPYSLSQAIVGWIFIVYITGTFSSAWMGRMSDKHGRFKMLLAAILIMILGACTTLFLSLPLKVLGIATFTFGFFGGHSIASGWVGYRASHNKAQASSLYLFFYYAGSSIGGTLGGIFWTTFGWGGVIGMIVCSMILAVILTTRLKSVVPACAS